MGSSREMDASEERLGVERISLLLVISPLCSFWAGSPTVFFATSCFHAVVASLCVRCCTTISERGLPLGNIRKTHAVEQGKHQFQRSNTLPLVLYMLYLLLFSSLLSAFASNLLDRFDSQTDTHTLSLSICPPAPLFTLRCFLSSSQQRIFGVSVASACKL